MLVDDSLQSTRAEWHHMKTIGLHLVRHNQTNSPQHHQAFENGYLQVFDFKKWQLCLLPVPETL
jgi:hypothetical protein